MKKIFFAALLLSALQINAQRYMTKTGTINFSASTPIEKIEGINKSAACILDTKTGIVNFVIQIKSFVFEKQLMQEHFNENYLESDKYPKAAFRGNIANLSSITFDKDGEYDVEVIGKMTIHGVTKDLKTKGKIVIKNGLPTLKANVSLLMADYKIEIPGAVKDKISKEVKMIILCALEAMK